MQLYRMLWIYIAIHDLGRANPSKGALKPWNPAYRSAAIKIAQELTPLLVAGGELDIDQVEAGKFFLPSAGGLNIIHFASWMEMQISSGWTYALSFKNFHVS